MLATQIFSCNNVPPRADKSMPSPKIVFLTQDHRGITYKIGETEVTHDSMDVDYTKLTFEAPLQFACRCFYDLYDVNGDEETFIGRAELPLDEKQYTLYEEYELLFKKDGQETGATVTIMTHFVPVLTAMVTESRKYHSLYITLLHNIESKTDLTLDLLLIDLSSGTITATTEKCFKCPDWLSVSDPQQYTTKNGHTMLYRLNIDKAPKDMVIVPFVVTRKKFSGPFDISIVVHGGKKCEKDGKIRIIEKLYELDYLNGFDLQYKYRGSYAVSGAISVIDGIVKTTKFRAIHRSSYTLTEWTNKLPKSIITDKDWKEISDMAKDE